MNQDQIEAVDHMQSVLKTAIGFLNQVREREWTIRLCELQHQTTLEPATGAAALLIAFTGERGLDSLYLSGPRNGHALSERQEIQANGKLHVIRAELLHSAKEVVRVHAE